MQSHIETTVDNFKPIEELKRYYFVANLFFLALAVSCVKEDYGECGPGGEAWKHIVSVIDKNYSNAAEFGDPVVVVDESLPFYSWVNTLTLWRNNPAASDYQVYAAQPNQTAPVHEFSVDEWPAGNHRVTAIGNETVLSQTYNQSSTTIALHPEGREYNDIYMGAAGVAVSPTADVDIGLRRTKGMLVVFLENIPASTQTIYISVDNVCAAVDGDMNYSGTTSVTKGFQVSGTDMTMTVKLAPTMGAGTSTVGLTLVDADGVSHSRDLTTVTMKRNEVSGIRFAEGHELFVFSDGEWSRVTPLYLVSQ